MSRATIQITSPLRSTRSSPIWSGSSPARNCTTASIPRRVTDTRDRGRIMADQPPLAAHAAQAQSPSAGALNLDHAAHFVADIDAASAALQQMGFTLTPFSPQEHRLAPDLPLVAAGTANRCVMLQAGYLEFLCPVGDTPMAAQLQAAMARYVGVHLIAFGTAAPQADAARLQANGFAPLPIVDLQRTIGTADGERTARFTVVRVAPGRMAEGRIQ